MAHHPATPADTPVVAADNVPVVVADAAETVVADAAHLAETSNRTYDRIHNQQIPANQCPGCSSGAFLILA